VDSFLHHSFSAKYIIGDNFMKDFIKNKKVWIGIAVVIIVIGWAVWSGQPAPEIQG
tara:strand:+ start:66 stop:233 length:168 start_codon:yes stop_codon:yes gene_type:complete